MPPGPPPGPAPVDLGALSVRGLVAARRAVLAALVTVSKRTDTGLDVLGLGPGQRDELARNVAVRHAPAYPAAEIYTGVLYASLDIGTLPPDASARLDRSVLVFSGLWGVLRLGDRIPPYRCSIGITLPGVGGLAAHWRRALARPMRAVVADDLVLDLRSTGYASHVGTDRRGNRPNRDRTRATRTSRRRCRPAQRGQSFQQGDEGPDRS